MVVMHFINMDIKENHWYPGVGSIVGYSRRSASADEPEVKIFCYQGDSDIGVKLALHSAHRHGVTLGPHRSHHRLG